MLRCGFRRRLTSFATGAVERRLSSFTKTTAGAVELKISASGLFSSDSTLLRARIFDTPTGQACLRPPSATVAVPHASRLLRITPCVHPCLSYQPTTSDHEDANDKSHGAGDKHT